MDIEKRKDTIFHAGNVLTAILSIYNSKGNCSHENQLFVSQHRERLYTAVAAHDWLRTKFSNGFGNTVTLLVTKGQRKKKI